MDGLLAPGPPLVSVTGLSPSQLRHLAGLVFVLLMLPVSLVQIAEHLRNFRCPAEQRALVRIIAMVPLFGIVSLISLSFDSLALYIQMLRESYEAFSIYCFLKYLISYLGDDEALAAKLAQKPARIGVHKPPFCCLSPWSMGEDFLVNCKLGALQYVVVRSSVSFAAGVLYTLGLYEEGLFHPRSPYFWLTGANCVSQTWALYTLVLFYHATYKDLIAIHPFSKFLCIKGVVFFSWWQGLVIHVMVHQGLIADTPFKRKERIAKGIQDTLVCVEMLVASLAFYICFPSADYAPKNLGATKRYGSYNLLADAGPSLRDVMPVATTTAMAAKPAATLRHTRDGDVKASPAAPPRVDTPDKKATDKGRMPIWQAIVWVIFPLDVRADIAGVLSKKARLRRLCGASSSKVASAVNKQISNRAVV